MTGTTCLYTCTDSNSISIILSFISLTVILFNNSINGGEGVLKYAYQGRGWPQKLFHS